MICPKCRTKMKVVDSRQLLSNLRKRYYKCPKCDYRPTTSERFDIEKPAKLKNNTTYRKTH